MGENCSANSRLIVQKGAKPKLVKHILARLRDWKTGDPLDPENHLGALIDADHCKKVASYLKSPKGTVLAGGTVDGNFVAPTVIDDVSSKDKLAKEEIFGPVLSIITVATLDEALEIANDSQYGLAASIFTANGKKALAGGKGNQGWNCHNQLLRRRQYCNALWWL